MTDHAAIKATFVDLRSVKSRSQTQLIFEVPIEQTDAALEALGGYPQPQEGKWVAIARINETAARAEPEKPKRAPATTRAEKARRLCGVATFRQFVEKLTEPMPQKWADDISDYEKCSTRVKWWCSVPTKNDLDVNSKAAKQWDALLSEYEQQAGRMAERY